MKAVNPNNKIDEAFFRDPEFSRTVKEAVKVCIDPIIEPREGQTLKRVMQRIQEEESKKNLK